MLSTKMQETINEQINYEFYSAYIYLSMSAYYTSLNLPGFANWMFVQAQEEMTHAMKFYTFINDRGGRVHLATIEGPETDWSAPIAPFKVALEHERRVTTRINNLVTLAMEERDYATNTFLQWFVTEQVEEEKNADEIIRQLELIGDERSALFMIDRELATRIFIPPVPTQ